MVGCRCELRYCVGSVHGAEPDLERAGQPSSIHHARLRRPPNSSWKHRAPGTRAARPRGGPGRAYGVSYTTLLKWGNVLETILQTAAEEDCASLSPWVHASSPVEALSRGTHTECCRRQSATPCAGHQHPPDSCSGLILVAPYSSLLVARPVGYSCRSRSKSRSHPGPGRVSVMC